MMKILLFVFVMVAQPLKANTLEVIFEHNPPFQMVDTDGKGYGPVYDFAMKLIQIAHLQASFTAKPWARIMAKDAKKPNKLILSISKTPQREPNFIWLISVYTGQQYIWKKRNSIDPETLCVSVERNSHKVSSIKSHFKNENVFEFLNSTQALKALIKGRVHRFVGTTFAVSGKLASLGYELNILEQLSAFDEAGLASQGLYLTLTLGTDKEVVLALQEALKDPEVAEVRNNLFETFYDTEQELLLSQLKMPNKLGYNF